MKTRNYTIILLVLSLYSLFILTERFLSKSLLISGSISIIITAGIYFISKNYLLHLQRVKTIHFFGIIIFYTAITTPLIHEMDQLNDYEKRIPAPFPKFEASNIWAFPKGLKAYFNDAFAFRNTLIKSHIKVQTEIFDVSPNPQSVSISKDNWLFFVPKNYIEQCSKPLTEDELDKIVDNLKFKKKFLNDRGIKFYLTIPPIKAHFYKEKLPHRLQLSFKHSKLDQLTKHLKKYPEINFIDLDTVLKQHKKIMKIYYQSDTHWNKLAAFYAYQAIMKRIINDFPQLSYLKLDDMIVKEIEMQGGDLNDILGDPTLFPKSGYSVLRRGGEKAVKVKPNDFLSKIPRLSQELIINENKNVNNKLKLCVFRDSFTEYLYPHFSENFARSSYPWRRDISAKYIIHEQPDIVIHELLERFIFKMVDLPLDFKVYQNIMVTDKVK